MFINISSMSSFMIDYIDAPIPYIVGIPRDAWKGLDKGKKESLASEVIIYDIDKKKLKCCLPLPSLPDEETNYIHKAITNIVANKGTAENVCS